MKKKNVTKKEKLNNTEESPITDTIQSNGEDNATDAKVLAIEDSAKENNMEVKFGLKSFLTICGILLGVMIVVGILTFVIPAGTYDLGEDGQIIGDSFHFVDDAKPLPIWRWLTAPFEAIVVGSGNFTTIQIIVLLLILGGTFNVLAETGGLVSVVRIIVNKFYKHRYVAIWLITLVMMLLASLFGLQEELLVLFPVFLMFASAMNWDKVQAIRLVLITTGVGFTVAILNPFTVGICSELAGISVVSGIWFRVIMFAVFYVLTSLYLMYKAKQSEKANANEVDNIADFQASNDEEAKADKRKAKMIFILFGVVLAVIILSVAVPFLEKLGISMILMAVAFIIGTFVVGSLLLGSFKKMIKAFGKGVLNIAPSIAIIMLAFSVKYIAECGGILHTIFYYFNNLISSTSPYVAVLLMYALVLIIEFFIPGSSSKAMLLIPLLTLAPISGISKNIIILVFLFADGYTNVLYPTCGTLVIGLSLAKVSYLEWLKKTIVFQLILFALSIGFLYIGIAIGL